MPRGIGLTYDGMRRCQRLPELRTPLIPRDAKVNIKLRTRAVRGISWQNAHPRLRDRPIRGTRLTSGWFTLTPLWQGSNDVRSHAASPKIKQENERKGS